MVLVPFFLLTHNAKVLVQHLIFGGNGSCLETLKNFVSLSLLMIMVQIFKMGDRARSELVECCMQCQGQGRTLKKINSRSMVTNFPAMLVKQIFPLELTSEYEKKVTNNRDINKTFILPPPLGRFPGKSRPGIPGNFPKNLVPENSRE